MMKSTALRKTHFKVTYTVYIEVCSDLPWSCVREFVFRPPDFGHLVGLSALGLQTSIFFLNYWSLDKMFYYYTPPYTFQEHRPSVCCLGLNKRLGFTLTVPIYTISPQKFSGKNGLIRAGILYKIHFILFFIFQMAERHFFFFFIYPLPWIRLEKSNQLYYY